MSKKGVVITMEISDILGSGNLAGKIEGSINQLKQLKQSFRLYDIKQELVVVNDEIKIKTLVIGLLQGTDEFGEEDYRVIQVDTKNNNHDQLAKAINAEIKALSDQHDVTVLDIKYSSIAMNNEEHESAIIISKID